MRNGLCLAIALAVFSLATLNSKPMLAGEAGDSEAQQAAPAGGELRDVLVLTSGAEQRGLLVSEGDPEIVFDVIVSGRSVSKTLLMRMKFNRSEVKELRKLTDEQRTTARGQLEKVAAQAKQDVAAERNIKIEPHEWETKDHQKVAVKKVELDCFVIESDMDDAFLRRCAFRLGKVFAAYKQHFGVDRNDAAKVRVLLFNSMAEYYASIGGEIKNPALYSPDLKSIAAGCDVAGYEVLIKEIKAKHAKFSQQLDEYKLQIKQARANITAAGLELSDAIRRAGATQRR